MQAVSPERVRQLTQSVLERPEFREGPGSLWASLLSGFFRWLASLGSWSQANPDLSSVVILVLAILVLGLLCHIAHAVIHEFVSLRRRSSAPRAGRPLQALEGVAGNWGEAFQLAKTALEAGDLYRAIWITHRILLSALDRLELLKFARWKTNSDYLRECGATGSVSHTFVEVTGAYERVIYAHADFDRDEAARLLALVEAVTNETG